MRDLLVITPSRGRPGRLKAMMDGAIGLADMNTDVVAGIDADDRFLPAYQALPEYPRRALICEGPRDTVSGWTNKLAAANAGRYRAFCVMNDDHLPRTQGWDRLLLEAIETMGGTGFAYGDDLLQRQQLCTSWVVTADIVNALGWVAEPSMRHYCVTPETPVLTADLHWVAAGKLSVGDELVGSDEHPPRTQCGRAFRRSTVLQVARRIADCLELTLEDGRQVTCSTDHRWLAKRQLPVAQRSAYLAPDGHASKFNWVASAALKVGDRIVSPLRVWDDESSFDAGWLSGIFDGEGCVSRQGKTGAALSVSQNPGPVLKRICATLDAMGIRYTTCLRASQRDDCTRVTISPRSHAVELLGRLQTVRLNSAMTWENRSVQARTSASEGAVVASVSPVGMAEVVSLRTSTATYIANGMVANNCIDNVILHIGLGAKCLAYCEDVIVEHMYHGISKAPWDETYASEAALDHLDKKPWATWLAERKDADIATVKALLAAKPAAK